MRKVQKMQSPLRARARARGCRPTDAEIAERLDGTRGRCFTRDGEEWRDTQTGTCGTRAELEKTWLAGLPQ